MYLLFTIVVYLSTFIQIT